MSEQELLQYEQAVQNLIDLDPERAEVEQVGMEDVEFPEVTYDPDLGWELSPTSCG